MSLEFENLTPTIGTVIHGIDLGDADALARHAAEIRRTLFERQVIFFRKQTVSAAAQVRFAQGFGEVRPVSSTFPVHPDSPYVEILESKSKYNSTDVWHCDLTWQKVPPLGACLYAVEVPATGGDTLWTSMTAACEALAPKLRDYLSGAEAIHNWETPELLRAVNSSPDAAKEYARMRETYPPVRHPVIKKHSETGKPILFVNDFYTTEIVGMSRGESDSMLRYLTALATTPEFQVRFRWEPGSVAVWDNQAVQHYAVNDYYPARRKMHRITIFPPAQNG
jgi:taurine dioxygenase